MIKAVNIEMGIARYKISRCVNAGDFHKVLSPNNHEELVITECIPLCCKVELTGFEMPLTITINRREADSDIKVFVSFKNPEPSRDKCD